VYILSVHLTENVLISILYPRVSKEEKCVTYMLVSNQLVARSAGVPGTAANVVFIDSSLFVIS
jgi:hypothetical protein